MKEHWLLDRRVLFLNHGSFGATPADVLAQQQEWTQRMEREPVLFLARELENLLDAAREEMAALLGADAGGFVFVANATAGVNAVLRSLDLDVHDELLVTTHEYNACRNVLDYVAGLAGARVVTVDIPFPIASADVVVDRVLAAVTARTRLLLIDHVTSQTALVFPIERIVSALNERGIDTLVDGAHAPGMLDLNLRRIGAAYYTGNFHKWVCAPKGAAFLYVRENRRAGVRPAQISHGSNSPRRDRSRFLLEFDWTGTSDPTPWLCVPAAWHFMERVGGSWPEIREKNRSLALEAQGILAEEIGIAPPAPPEMIGSMASFPLPDGAATAAPSLYGDPLQDALFTRFSIEVPIVPWPIPPRRLLRISAQLYNERAEYQELARALTHLLREEQNGDAATAQR